MGSGLAAPFYVALARDDLGGDISLLGIFIAVDGRIDSEHRGLSAWNLPAGNLVIKNHS
jgi:hypothetical protein